MQQEVKAPCAVARAEAACSSTAPQKVYLDYNATTPVAPEVLSCVAESMEKLWGNPSSKYETGRRAKEALDKARESVADVIGARPEEIIFLSGGTEANNLVIHTALEAFRKWNKSSSNDLDMKPHFVATAVEHPAILSPLKHLEKCKLADVTLIPLDPKRGLDPESILSCIRPSTCLVSIMMANNETGMIFPVAEICRVIERLNQVRRSQKLFEILTHTDAAQTIGKVLVEVTELNADYLTIVGHKFYGPRVGALYARNLGRNGEVHPMMFGGGQERGYRPGTENTAMMVGLGRACELVKENLDCYQSHMKKVRDYLEGKLESQFQEHVKFNRFPGSRLPNICSVRFVGISGQDVLDKCQVLETSCGAACHSGRTEPSSVLLASGLTKEEATSTIRLSIGRETTTSDIDAVILDFKCALKFFE